MKILTEKYRTPQETWPVAGRHIMAQYDDTSIIVYQAYNKSIGKYAAANQRFGGGFSFERMSWIKPNILWMMFRSGRGRKKNLEITLAIRLTQEGFLDIQDISGFVHDEYQKVKAGRLDELYTPLEKTFPVRNERIHKKLGLS